MSEKEDMKKDNISPRPRRRRGPRGRPSLKLAKSIDGLHFEKLERTVVERGGVPDLLADYGNGRIVATFQYHHGSIVALRRKMVVSFSYDEGETWMEPQAINLQGLPEVKFPEVNRPVDPDLVLLDDGRYRLYFTYPPPDTVSARSKILSAISDDCINFTVEEGFRSPIVEGTQVIDPSVIKIDDTWHLYSWHQIGMKYQGKNYHAVSEDGLNFTKVDDIVLEMNMLGNPESVKDGYRFYGTGSKGMTAFSTDGYNWIQEDVKLPGPDSGVVRLKDGTYLMLYTAMQQLP